MIVFKITQTKEKKTTEIITWKPQTKIKKKSKTIFPISSHSLSPTLQCHFYLIIIIINNNNLKHNKKY